MNKYKVMDLQAFGDEEQGYEIETSKEIAVLEFENLSSDSIIQILIDEMILSQYAKELAEVEYLNGDWNLRIYEKDGRRPVLDLIEV